MAQARVVKLLRILRKYTLQFQFLFLVLTCSHILLCQPKLNDPHSLKAKFRFSFHLSMLRWFFALSDIEHRKLILVAQFIFLTFDGVKNVNRPMITASPITVSIHTEELEIVKPLEVSSSSTCSRT